MPEAVVQAFRDSGLFALQIPRSLGGFEADIETALGVYEIVCRADASTGWSLLANASTSAFATHVHGRQRRRRDVRRRHPDARRPVRATWDGDRRVRRRVPDQRELQLRERERARRLDRWRHARARRRRAAHGHAGTAGDPRLLRTARPRRVRGQLGRDGPRRHRELRLRRAGAGRRRRVHVRHDRRPAASEAARCTASACSGSRRSGTRASRSASAAARSTRSRSSRRGSSAWASMSVLADQERFQYELGRNDAAMRAARALVYDAFGTAQEKLDAGDDFDMLELLSRCGRPPRGPPTSRRRRFASPTSRRGATGSRNPSVIGRYFRDIHAATQHVVRRRLDDRAEPAASSGWGR